MVTLDMDMGQEFGKGFFTTGALKDEESSLASMEIQYSLTLPDFF
jgi:hypothetical protein